MATPRARRRRAPAAVVVAAVAIGLLAAAEAACRLLAAPPSLVPSHSPLFLNFISDLESPFFRPEGNGEMVPARRTHVWKETRFQRRKPEGVYRVICVGESTVALGDFTRFLQAYLEKARPDRRVEVINAGQGFINPREVARVHREIMDYEPDLVVLYMGHNYQHQIPRVSAAAFTAARWADRSALLRSSALALRRVLGAPASAPRFEPERDYEEALGAIAGLSRERGVPLVACTAAANLLIPPRGLASGLGDERRQRLYGEALLAYESGRLDAAERGFARLSEAYPAEPLFHYYRGLIARAAGRRADARARFEAARDLDTNGRAPSPINGFLRSKAASWGYVVADVEAAFAAASPDGIPDYREFLDNCHPRPARYALIAENVLRAMEKSSVLPGRWRWDLLLPAREGIARALTPRERPEDAALALVRAGFIAALGGSVYGEPAFSEICVSYFDQALSRDVDGALAALSDPAVSDVRRVVLTTNRVTDEAAESTRLYGFLHAAVALRRRGREADALRLLEQVARSADTTLRGHALIQTAFTRREHPAPGGASGLLEQALRLDARLRGDPYFQALAGTHERL